MVRGWHLAVLTSFDQLPPNLQRAVAAGWVRREVQRSAVAAGGVRREVQRSVNKDRNMLSRAASVAMALTDTLLRWPCPLQVMRESAPGLVHTPMGGYGLF